jgi:NitT/TauT family transport system substrate-binding protein
LLVARSQGVPLVYVATWFQKFPISVIALEGANIRRVEDLKGRSVGVPGRFGATYVGLRALLASAGLSEADLQLREVGFEQVQALTQGRVEAVVGYTNNEPLQMRSLGQAITTLNVFDRVNLVSNGLVASEKTLRDRPELVERMTRAFLRGLQDTIDRPREAVDITVAGYVPEAAGQRELLRQVLDASIPLWQSDLTARQGLGAIEPAAWGESRDLLRRLGLLGGEVELEQAYTTRFLPRRP